MSEFNLSEKIDIQKDKFDDGFREMILADDVKKFIRLAREILRNCIDSGLDDKLILDSFDKIAGDKLL